MKNVNRPSNNNNKGGGLKLGNRLRDEAMRLYRAILATIN